MDRTGHIDNLITMYTVMKDEPGVNKKAVNKTIARLEEARLWAKEIQPGRVNGVPGNQQSFKGSVDDVKEMVAAGRVCTCPPGVEDKVNCPVHKQ